MSIYDKLANMNEEETPSGVSEDDLSPARPETEYAGVTDPESPEAQDAYERLLARNPQEDENDDGEGEEYTPKLSMSNVNVTVDDITHPSVVAIGVSATARGTLPVDKVDAKLEPLLPKGLKLGGVSPTVALKRAMVSLTKGDTDREVKTKGRKSSAVYTILSTDMERIDREEHDGKGVSDAEVSARIEYDGSDKYTIKISPPEHPAAALIRERQDEFCGVYSATYDLKVWFTTKLLPYLGAVRTPNVQGGYILPKHDNAESVKLLTQVRDAFEELRSEGTGKLAIYLDGKTEGNANALDIIADAMEDEKERVLGKLSKELDAVTSGKKTVGKRRLASMTAEAHELRETLQKMAASFSLGSTDAASDIEDIEAQIAVCELALD